MNDRNIFLKIAFTAFATAVVIVFIEYLPIIKDNRRALESLVHNRDDYDLKLQNITLSAQAQIQRLEDYIDELPTPESEQFLNIEAQLSDVQTQLAAINADLVEVKSSIALIDPAIGKQMLRVQPEPTLKRLATYWRKDVAETPPEGAQAESTPGTDLPIAEDGKEYWDILVALSQEDITDADAKSLWQNACDLANRDVASWTDHYRYVLKECHKKGMFDQTTTTP